MNIAKTIVTGVGTLLLASTLSSQALASATNGLRTCKAEISQDSQLSGYSRVDVRMDSMDTRGGYTYFQLNVTGRTASGEKEAWNAECKTLRSGKVEELQVTRVAEESAQQVAKSGS